MPLAAHHCARRATLLAVAMFAAAPAQRLAADDLLLIHADSLTDYKPASTHTRINDLRPLVLQRGVHIDGTIRYGNPFGWAISANPFGEAWNGKVWLGPVNLATGEYAFMDVQVALPAMIPWPIGIAYNGRQYDGGHDDSDGLNGYNIAQTSWPEILVHEGDTDADDVVFVLRGAGWFVEYRRIMDDETPTNYFRGVNGAAGIIQYVEGSPDVYRLTTQTGHRVSFFGGDTDSDKGDWQLWKIEDPWYVSTGGTSGNIAYVGDKSSASTAVTNGFDASDRMTTAYDSTDRRITYSYSGSAIGTKARLIQVKVETRSGANWGSPGTITEVARVIYDYYTNDNDDNGKAGDLKLITVRTRVPESDTDLDTTSGGDSNIYHDKKMYFRWYDDTYADSNGRRGVPHTLRMAVGYAGYHKFDMLDSNLDDDPLSVTPANEGDLKPYALAFLEYMASNDDRLKSAFFSGECGCSGGVNGTYTFTYATKASGSDDTGYDEASDYGDWAQRTVVVRPDSSYLTLYTDEAGQPLSEVITDGDPTESPQQWVTHVLRDDTDGNSPGGLIVEIHTPANNEGYTHDIEEEEVMVPSGTFNDKEFNDPEPYAGMVTVFTRLTSTDLKGFVEFRKHKRGHDGTAYPDHKTTYTTTSLTVGDGTVVRPVAASSRAYHTTTESGGADTYDETSFAYTFWSASASDYLVVAPKLVTTTFPKVSAGNNGLGSGGGDAAVESKRYVRKDGTTAFVMSPAYSTAANSERSYAYTQFTSGQLTKQVADITTTGSFPSGDDPNGDFAITETGDGLDAATVYTYDPLGRPDTTTLADGRVMQTTFSRLADHRLVSVSIPRVVAGSPTYYGPVTYTVYTQAGKAELTAVSALASSGITTALTSWIDETKTDAIEGLTVGKITRMNRTEFDPSGTRATESRAYMTIPATIGADSSSNYDLTEYAFDEMGRSKRTKTAAGTITRLVFDKMDRLIERWVGTNDNSNGALTGGSSTMTKVEALEYDGGADDGNSQLSERTLIVDSTDDGGDAWDDDRVTTYLHDYRGRLIVTLPPQAPYTVAAYDNLGRQTAAGLYSSTSGLDAGDSPTSLATNRVGLSRTFYDEMGRVCKTQFHKIDVGDGSDDDNRPTLTWFDGRGRVVKISGEQLLKRAYDRLDRQTHEFILSAVDVDEDTYAEALDPTDDFTLEEHQAVYESADSDNVVMRVAISRFHDDGTNDETGPLDLNTDGANPSTALVLTAADVLGRAQITAFWHDALDRVTTTAFYGTYSGSTFDYGGLGEPSASAADKIVTKSGYTYDDSGTTRDDGLVHDATDAMGKVTRFAYDGQARKITEIRNYVNGTPSGDTGDDDNYTRYQHTNGLLTKMIVDFDGDNVIDTTGTPDQATTYIYGTTKGTPSLSKIATGHLLRAIKYPDTSNGGTTVANIDSDSSDVVSFAYNAQGQEVYKKDQATNETESRYDTGGRLVHTMAIASSPPGGWDYTVKRITRTYTSRGQLAKVTQFNTTTIGAPDTSGIVDQCEWAYEDWWHVSSFTQDPDSAIGGGGRASFATSFTYERGSTGRQSIRRLTQTSPGLSTVNYDYFDSSFRHDEAVSRVTRIRVGSTTTVASYQYNGVGQVVQTKLDEPVATWNLFGGGVYPGLDVFNRIVDCTWDQATLVFYDTTIAYDYASNITSVEDHIHTSSAAGAGNGLLDYGYVMDSLHRLKQAEMGHWTGSAITPMKRNERWLTSAPALALTQPGNWEHYRLDLDGDENFNEAGELDETRTHTVANELTDRNTDSAGGAEYTRVYDAAGNLINDDQFYEFVYDWRNQLRKVFLTGTATLVAEYTYNGLNHRIGWHYDVDDGAGGGPDAAVDSDDPWYWFCYDDKWRVVATFRASDANPKEAFVYHAAGLDGMGGSSYIDAEVLREKDANTAWYAASDVLEQRLYFMQNQHQDVAVVQTAAGNMVETVKYTPYGLSFAMPAGDGFSDGDFDAADETDMTNGGTTDVRLDTDTDGDNDANDVTAAKAMTSGYQTLGWNVLSSTGVNNRKGYCGYEYLPELEGSKAMYLARHRNYEPAMGTWIQRDPAGYVDGPNLYSYVGDSPLVFVDPAGLATGECLRYKKKLVQGTPFNQTAYASSFWGTLAHQTVATVSPDRLHVENYGSYTNGLIGAAENVIGWCSDEFPICWLNNPFPHQPNWHNSARVQMTCNVICDATTGYFELQITGEPSATSQGITVSIDMHRITGSHPVYGDLKGVDVTTAAAYKQTISFNHEHNGTTVEFGGTDLHHSFALGSYLWACWCCKWRNPNGSIEDHCNE